MNTGKNLGRIEKDRRQKRNLRRAQRIRRARLTKKQRGNP